MKASNIIIRYLIATFGLFLVALGVALSIKSNLGTSSLSCPSYVMEPIFGFSVGVWTIIVNTCYTLCQFAVLGRKFKAKYLMQIPASFVFGYLIDLSLLCVDWIDATTLSSRLILILIACLVTAMGVSIEVIARAWMLSAEMLVYIISKTYKLQFNRVKIVMDCSLVVISALISFLLYHNFFGKGEFEGIMGILNGQSQGVVIGTGTILMSFLAGGFMKFTDPIANRFMDNIIKWKIYKGQDPRSAVED